MNKKFVKCFRLDEESLRLWNELKKYKINPADVLREPFKEAAKKKLIELKLTLKESIYPF